MDGKARTPDEWAITAFKRKLRGSPGRPTPMLFRESLRRVYLVKTKRVTFYPLEISLTLPLDRTDPDSKRRHLRDKFFLDHRVTEMLRRQGCPFYIYMSGLNGKEG